MNIHSQKSIAWTVLLILFLVFAICARLQWLSLLIPGALLMWYGLVKPAPRSRIALQKLHRGGLH